MSFLNQLHFYVDKKNNNDPKPYIVLLIIPIINIRGYMIWFRKTATGTETGTVFIQNKTACCLKCGHPEHTHIHYSSVYFPSSSVSLSS